MLLKFVSSKYKVDKTEFHAHLKTNELTEQIISTDHDHSTVIL